MTSVTQKIQDRQDQATRNLSYIVGMYKGVLDQIVRVANDEDGDYSANLHQLAELKKLATRADRYLQIGEEIWNARFDRSYSEIIEDFANDKISLAKK